MKTIKILLTLSLFTLTFYSCEPEEFPETHNNFSADTGNQGDVIEDRKED